MTKTLAYGMVDGGPGASIDGVHRRATGLDETTIIAAGVFSRNREKSLQTTEELDISIDRCHGDYRTMARVEGEWEDETDFVVVVTSNQSHYKAYRVFLEAGAHVACDEPVTITCRQVRELEALVEGEGLPLMVTYTYIGHMIAKYARGLVASGVVGEVRTAMAEYPQGWFALEDDSGGKQGEWCYDPQQSDGANYLGDLGTHVENAVAAMTELRTKRPLAKMDAIIPGCVLDDNDNILAEYDNGVTGIYWTSQVTVGHDGSLRIRIYGSRGTVQWSQETPERITVIDADGTIREIHRGYGAIGEKAGRCGRLPTGYPEGWIEAMDNLYRGFVECIRAKQEGTSDPEMADYPTVSQGIEGLAFVEARPENSKNGNTRVELERK